MYRYIDIRLTFSDHIISCCNKAARQLNALSRLSKCLDLNYDKVIFGLFVLRNFTYFPNFCCKQTNNKDEKSASCIADTLWWWYLWISRALNEPGTNTMRQSWFKSIILEVFTSMHDINPACIQIFLKLVYLIQYVILPKWFNRTELSTEGIFIMEVNCGTTRLVI